ncbi:hypothetical protein G3T14_19695 [Methylobacterium sp. BTF04]|uniref:hypothetical protein n=1 Tax=Methylobacterium sp. BTF04 TaxID=2708300 RepID=UPI0013CF4186|nr:hypothetical protein [Methylobacterium sp. BTF04]NEU14333.1 hypothetical protein [Methylobacterium sp. BTF04]
MPTAPTLSLAIRGRAGARRCSLGWAPKSWTNLRAFEKSDLGGDDRKGLGDPAFGSGNDALSAKPVEAVTDLIAKQDLGPFVPRNVIHGLGKTGRALAADGWRVVIALVSISRAMGVGVDGLVRQLLCEFRSIVPAERPAIRGLLRPAIGAAAERYPIMGAES